MTADDHATRTQQIADALTELGTRMPPEDRARLMAAVADLRDLVGQALRSLESHCG